MNNSAQRRLLASDILLGVIFLLISWLYLNLLLKDQAPTFGLAALGGIWLVYAILSKRLSYATPLDLPILSLLGLLPLSLAISVDWTLSLPKVYGLLVGVAIFYWIVNFVRNYRRLMLAILGLVLLALGINLLGAAGMDWSTSRFAGLVPDAIQLADFGIHANTLGGALTFFLPLLAALVWDGGAFHRLYFEGKGRTEFLRVAYKLTVIGVLLLAGGLVFLTDSRGALVGSAVGLLALAIWKDRRFAWLIPILLGAALVAFFLLFDGELSQVIALVDAGEDQTISGRLELWRNSLLILQDFPLTGVGIGTAGAVFDDLYIYEIFPYSTMRYLHTHNTFLGVAVYLGLPALVLYAAALTAFGMMAWRRLKIGRSLLRTLLMGLACGMLAHQVFGLMDAFLLGTKLGAILWIFLGLVTAVYVHKSDFCWRRSLDGEAQAAHMEKPRHAAAARLVDLLLGLAAWLLISLAAVSFVNISALLSVFLSILGGILLGFFLIKKFRKTTSKLNANS